LEEKKSLGTEILAEKEANIVQHDEPKGLYLLRIRA
jgi:hypothetical protein